MKVLLCYTAFAGNAFSSVTIIGDRITEIESLTASSLQSERDAIWCFESKKHPDKNLSSIAFTSVCKLDE